MALANKITTQILNLSDQSPITHWSIVVSRGYFTLGRINTPLKYIQNQGPKNETTRDSPCRAGRRGGPVAGQMERELDTLKAEVWDLEKITR